MAQSIIEGQRAEHAYIDRLESTLTSLLAQAPSKLHRDRLTLNHRAASLLSRIVDRSSALVAAYEDPNHERANELEALAGGGAQGSVTEFYGRLAKLKDHHRRYPEAAKRSAVESERIDYAELEGVGIVDGRDFLDRMFTGEEALGRYLDLVELHEQFINLPPRKYRGLSYLEYLDRFDQPDLIPRPAKGELYAKYVEALLRYLEGFCRRALPLYDADADLSAASDDFAAKWKANEIPGWSEDVQQEVTPSDGIWCAACQRMYAKQSVYDAHLTSKKHLKASEKLTASGQTNGVKSNGTASTAPVAPTPSTSQPSAKREKERVIARLEHLIAALLAVPTLAQMRKDTKSNVERRQALTDGERMLELEEMEERERKEAEEAAAAAERKAKKGGADDEEEEEEEERIYNPLKLPLGWDGKPIPYWLYKLHGLGVEYKCEICSGHVYMGRKNFDRHFQESRHSFGMRALGLPNTKHWHEITKIEDAIALAEKLKAEGKQEAYRVEEMEELEDAEGNVYNRKTYTDLQNQGLLA